MKKNEINKRVRNLDEDEAKDMLSNMITDTYTLILWPNSQELMNEKWFKKEAILETNGTFGSAAYFVPTFRIL